MGRLARRVGARLPIVALLACTTAGCARSLQPLPLRPQPSPWADTLPIAEPEEQDEQRIMRLMLISTPEGLAAPFGIDAPEALNLTHRDDVVSSSWWVRRMGYEPMTPAEVARAGTAAEGAPAAEGPLTIVSAKTAGTTPGMVVRDAKDDTYIVKFDPDTLPHLQSAPGVIVNRLMWAAGWHVPEDYLLLLDSARLVIGDEAEFEGQGEERPLRTEDVRRLLSLAGTDAEGRYLALASRYVPGVPKGVFYFDGRREDDPNDHFRHEHRRDLRGLRVVSAWVNNTDLREGNTLAVYVEPGYLRHYIIDFGATLGSASTRYKHPKDEVERPGAIWAALGRIFSLGLWEQGWEDDEWVVPHAGIGYLRGRTFEPEAWVASWQNPAFLRMTPADAYWGAKIVAAFDDEHIRAAVATGGLPEPWIADSLTALLAERRDRIREHWYGRVTPLEEVEVLEPGAAGGSTLLTFLDLGLAQDVWRPEGTRYRWWFEHDALGRSAEGTLAATGDALQRLEVPWEGGRGGDARPDGEAALAELRVQVERTAGPEADPRPITIWLRWTGRDYEVAGWMH